MKFVLLSILAFSSLAFADEVLVKDLPLDIRNATFIGTGCNEKTVQDWEAEVHQVSNSLTVYVVPCDLLKIQSSYKAFVRRPGGLSELSFEDWSEGGLIRAATAMELSFDPVDMTFSTFTKGRFEVDCGSYTLSKLVNTNEVQTLEIHFQSCNTPDVNVFNWPIVYPAQTSLR